MRSIKKNGFTLIEIVLAIAIVGIIVAAFTPVFANVLRTYIFNGSRIAASNIALNKLENIRFDIIDGQYDNIGTADGNPTGTYNQEEIAEYNSREFLVTTNISWEDETLAGLTDFDAYKKIEVTVQEINNSTDKKIIGPAVSHSTLVAKEAESSINENGSILVEARTRTGLKSDVRIDISSSSVMQYGFTDEEGKKIFADLEPATYTIDGSLPGLDMMFVPENKNGTYPNITWDPFDQITRTVNKFDKLTTFFEVDWPRYLDLTIVEGNGQTIDLSNYSSGLNFDLDFTIENDLTGSSDDYQISIFVDDQSDLDSLEDIKLWPRSEYDVTIEDLNTNHKFILSDRLSASESVGWDGLFENDNSSSTVEIDLIAAGSVVASPAAGSITSGTEITLNSDPAGFNIYYTTDGTEPDLSSPIYDNTNKEVLATDTTIKALAYKNGYLIGPVHTFTYTIN